MIYNIIAWLCRRPFRKCMLCGKISDKSLMVSDFEDWFCHEEHRRSYLDYTSTW